MDRSGRRRPEESFATLYRRYLELLGRKKSAIVNEIPEPPTMTESYAERRAEILVTLAKGPASRFGSDRLTDTVLRALKREGLVTFKAKNKGGQGWQLTQKKPA